jgi:hypothetical protein
MSGLTMREETASEGEPQGIRLLPELGATTSGEEAGMKNNRTGTLRRLRSLALFFLGLSTTLSLTTCDLFKTGFGDKVDITPPAVAISSPDQNSYVRGTLTVKGTASDDLSLSSLTIRYAGPSGTISKTVTVTNGAWSVDIPTGTGGAENLPDGEQRITATATDGSGKQVDALLLVYVDNIAPTVLVTVPQGYAVSRPIASDYVDVKGEVWDHSPITRVNIRVLDVGGTQIESKQADGTNTWSTRFTISSYTDLSTYRYAIEVTDKAGNRNSYYYHSQDIWALLPPATLFPATDQIGTLDQTRSGTVAGIDYATLYSHRIGFSGGAYGDFDRNADATLPVIHFSNLDPALPITSNVIGNKVPINGYVNPGPAGNLVNGASLKAWIIPWTTTPTWPPLPNVDSADVVWNPIGSSISFQVNTKVAGADIPSGRYIVRIRAGAIGTTSESTLTCSFLVDGSAPHIDQVSPDDLSLVKRVVFAAGTPRAGLTGIEIRAHATDDNSVQTFTAVASLDDSPWADLPNIGVAPDLGSPGWYWVQIPLGAGNTEIWFELEATDDAGTIARRTVHYTIDESAPIIAITAPAAGSWVAGDRVTVSGTSTDNSGQVKTIYLWMGLTASTPPADFASWTELNGNASWATNLPEPADPALTVEGSYTIHAYAFDFADNQSAEATRTFGLDQSSPTLTETGIGAAAVYRGTPFTLSGIAADTNALANITVVQKKDGGAPTTVLNQALSGTSQTWSWTLPGGATDGTFEYTITLTDTAGKTAPVVSRTVVYDTIAPAVSFTSVTPLVGVDTVNGVISYTASASDANGLSGVRRWVLPAADLDPSWATAGFTDWASTPYSDTLDTTTLSNGQQYKIWVMAQDKASRETAVSQTISVDQSSDNPVIGLTNMDASRTTPAGASANLQESNAKVQGTLTDDDSVDASTVQISIDGGAYTAVSQIGPDGKIVSFEHNLSALAEGVHYFSIQASDLASAKSGKLSVQTVLDPVYFAIDKNPPALAVTSPAQGSLHNAGFSLNGTASDANGLAGSVVRIKEGASVLATPAVASGNWTYPVNVAALSEGLKSWTVEAVDTFGKTTTVPFSFIVDTTTPAVSISAPAAGSWNTGATLSAVGTASDANGIVSVEWSTNGGSTWSAASGTVNWSVLLNLITLGEGSHTLSIRATDAAGNTSAATDRVFNVDQTPPDTSETSIGTPTASRKVLFDLAGTASDTNALASLTVEQKKDSGSWQTVYTNATLSGTSAPWSVPAASLPRNPAASDPSNPASALLADGSYEYRITVHDVAGNTMVLSRTVQVDLTPPTVAVSDPVADSVLVGTAYSVSGTAADTGGSGVATVYWWADNYGSTPPAGLGSWNIATGTTSWNALLNLTTLGEGRRTLSVKAVDGAANETLSATTVNFYIDQVPPVLSVDSPADGAIFSAGFTMSGTASDTNLSAVRVRINGGSWTAATGTTSWTYNVTIASLSVGLNTITVEASDIASRTTTQSIEVSRDQAAPVFAFNNLESDGSSVLMENSPKLVGSATDASGVAVIESYIESWNYSTSSWNAAPVEGWTSLGATANAKVFNWQKDLGATGLNLPEGRYRITLRSSDVAGPAANSTSGVLGTVGESVAFRLDRNNPALALTAPTQGSFQRTDFAASGTSGDANTISGVKVKIDSSDFGSGTVNATTSNGYATWSVTISTGSLGAGAHTLYVQGTDGTGRTTLLSRDFTFDNAAPTISVITPLSATTVNGAVTVKGTSSDANTVSSVELKIGKDTVWNTLPGVYSWEYAFTNIDTYANATFADETYSGSGVWRMYVYVRATDAAGNVGQINTYYLDLDPAMDSPIATIYQPLDNQTVGGSTRVYGIATDDDAVFRVEMQIDLNNDGDFADQSDYWNYSGVGTPTLGPDGDTNDRFERENVWYQVTGTTNWYQVINQFGEYNSATPGLTRTIQVRVRAIDTKNGSDPGIAGNFQQITITFDNTVPIIEDVQLDTDALDNGNEIPYSTGLRVCGTFWIVATVKDNGDVEQIDRIEQGPLSGTTRIDNDGSITTDLGVGGGYHSYKVRFPVNTLTIGGGVFADTSGSYAVSLKATDNTTPNPYVTFSYLNIQVDNYYPTGAYTGNTAQVLGTNYKIQGTGTDVGAGSGIVQGVDRIVAYFVKSGEVYDLKTAGPGNHAPLSGTLTLKDASTDNTVKSVAYPDTATYRISIDKMTEVGVSDGLPNGDLDGFLESLTVSGNTYDWWAEVDTTHLPDGPIDLHYVVFDKAGNGTHYVQTLYVRNNAPSIDSIVIGTDINGDGTIGNIASGESIQYGSGYGATGFTVRNNRLSITINASSGNGTRRYSMVYGGLERNGTLTSNTLTITDFSGLPDTAVNGAVFSITVFDSTVSDDNDPTNELTQTGAPLSLGMTFDNGDNTPPTLSAVTFGQKYTLPSPNRDADKALTAVGDYNENIVMSGSVRQGHVEYAADSRINGTDADISGKVIIKGKAWDDQRIQRITATITNFNGGSGAGSAFNIATWSGSGLTALSNASPYWAFSINASSEAVTEANGHVLNWDFAWDSSQMTGGAGYNQTVTFDIYDFGGNHYTVSPPAVDVDVVPYVTSIQRGNGVNTNRTKFGRYPVQEGETNLLVSGFNLISSTTQDANNWARVYNSGAGAYSAVTATAVAGAARTSVTLTLPTGTGSGYLRISANAIQDGNRQNDNTKTYNKEDDGSGLSSTLWNDDRYLHVWTVNQSFQSSDGAQYPSMSIMGDGTLYGAWINYASSLLYYGTTGAAPVTQWGIYDPPEYTDINVDASEATFKYALAFAANHYGGSGWGTVPLDAGSAGFLGVRTPNSRQMANGYGNAIAYPVESLNLNQQLWQFNRPKVVRSNGGASDANDRIHVAYYDSNTKAVKYSFMLDDGQATVRGWIVLDGGTDAQDVRYVTGIGTRTNTTLTDTALIGNTLILAGQTIMLMDTAGNAITNFNSGTGVITFASIGNNTRTNYTVVTGTSNLVTSGVAQSTSAGDYAAIDVDEDGLPVVIYYNTAAQTLRLARANKVNPTAPADWTRQDVFTGGDANAQYSGQHVAMKFDSQGGLHVVCYRSSTGDLLYLYAPDADGGAAYTFQDSVIVDSVGAVGTWADISLQGVVPHVSYLNSSMIGTFDGIKYATLRPITTNPVTSSTTTSATCGSIVNNPDVAAGQTILFSDNSSRVISAFNSATGQVSWVAPLGAAPGVGTLVKVLSTSDWEYEIAPASQSVVDQRTNIEVKRGAAAWGDLAIGYRSTRFELMYLKAEP